MATNPLELFNHLAYIAVSTKVSGHETTLKQFETAAVFCSSRAVAGALWQTRRHVLRDGIMQSVTIGGVKFNLPFAADERPFTEAERAEMKESIATHGIIDAIVCRQEDRKPESEEMVVVGATRAMLAAELGLKEIPKKHRSFKNMEEAREFNRQTSLRRHYTPEEQKARREARIPRVVERREAGESLRTIAEAESVSVATVQSDLATASAVQGHTAAPPNGQVAGQDGKTYTATPAKPVSLFCSKCQRVGPVKDCAECKRIKDEAKKPNRVNGEQGEPGEDHEEDAPKKRKSRVNGKQLTTVAEFENHLGHARLTLDKLAKQYGLAPEGKAIRGDGGYKAIEKHLSDALKAAKTWEKKHLKAAVS